jgi:hypothetical protein
MINCFEKCKAEIQVKKGRLLCLCQNMHILNWHNNLVKYVHIINIAAKLFYKVKIITSHSSKLSESSKVETEPIKN